MGILNISSGDAPESNPGEPFSRSFARESSKTQDDASLLEQIGKGDEGALALLFDRYSRMVFSVSLRVLRDPASAEDVLQEIFMQVWRKPDSFLSTRGSLGGWLAVVSRNRSIDVIRRRKPVDSIDGMTLASPFSVADDAERSLMIERARVAIGSIPADQRKAVEMAFFDGLTHVEIAELTGEPLGTIKTRIRAGLLAVRKAMQA